MFVVSTGIAFSRHSLLICSCYFITRVKKYFQNNKNSTIKKTQQGVYIFLAGAFVVNGSLVRGKLDVGDGGSRNDLVRLGGRRRTGVKHARHTHPQLSPLCTWLWKKYRLLSLLYYSFKILFFFLLPFSFLFASQPGRIKSVCFSFVMLGGKEATRQRKHHAVTSDWPRPSLLFVFGLLAPPVAADWLTGWLLSFIKGEKK